MKQLGCKLWAAVRRRPLLSFFSALAFLVALYMCLRPGNPYRAMYGRVHLGMSLGEVSQAVPLPPGVYCQNDELMWLERWAPPTKTDEVGTTVPHHKHRWLGS